MKDAEDEAFEEIERRQGAWGGGFTAKRKMAADKLQEPLNEAAIRADERNKCETAIEELLPDADRSDCAAAIRKRGLTTHCQCEACKNGNIHDSDCAVHNGPAYPAGPCDCSLAALAQPAQKPVANSFEEYCQTLHPLWNTHISRTYAEQFFMAGQAAQPAQEPTGMLHITRLDKWLDASLKKRKQREWVGLTDEEIGDAYVAWDDTDGASFADFARAIEAKLKEKNG